MFNRKSTKLPTAWPSEVSKPYNKLNTIIGEFTSVKKNSMNFAAEVNHIKTKLLQADYALSG